MLAEESDRPVAAVKLQRSRSQRPFSVLSLPPVDMFQSPTASDDDDLDIGLFSLVYYMQYKVHQIIVQLFFFFENN